MADRQTLFVLGAFALALGTPLAHADVLDQVGVTQLRAAQPTLTGTGVAVGLIESSTFTEDPPDSGNFFSNNDFQMNWNFAHGIPITYINNQGVTATTFPNAIGTESGHANIVGNIFFGVSGIAPGVEQIFNVEADRFLNHFVAPNIALDAKVINQSFGGLIENATDLALFEQVFDNYVWQQGVIVVSGAGNGGQVIFPASFMNGIAVGAYLAPSSQGPLPGGRSKPDLVAPGSATSYAAPVVSGISTILVQAGRANIGGANTSTSSTDPRTVKTLLLSGALKPGGWSNTESAPLHPIHGAGLVNAYTSYTILAGGKSDATTTNHTTSLGGSHDAVNTGTARGMRGWNFKNLSNLPSNNSDAVDHYLLDLTGNGGISFSATLTWYHPYSDSVARGDENYTLSGLNNFDLYLYDALTNTRITASTSTIDNVEHIFLASLPAGRYDLQVLKNGGGFSRNELYALAWRANLLGDANFDNAVNALDLNIMANNWQGNGKLWTDGDFNADGVVNAFDLNMLAANWQVGASTTLAMAMESSPLFAPFAARVPEPASLPLLGAVAALLLRRRGRKP